MKTITITIALLEQQFVRLERAAQWRDKSLTDLLQLRLIDLFEDPADPFDPSRQRLGEWDQALLRRLA